MGLLTLSGAWHLSSQIVPGTKAAVWCHVTRVGVRPLRVVDSAAMDDVDGLWALVSGVLLLAMAAGMGAVIEGFTRRRSVSTGSGRHLVAAAGAVVGVFATAATVPALVPDRTGETGGIWLVIGSSVVLAIIVSGGIVERGTFLAHAAVGVVAGGVVVPVADWARDPGGVLDSIAVSGVTFSDAAAATLFSVAGWMALVGIMVIGPRRGRLGADGTVRSIPGKSMPAAAIGAVLVFAAAVGAIGRTGDGWSAAILDAAEHIAIAGAAGVVVGWVFGRGRFGASSTGSLIQGGLAGLVSSMGAPFDLTEVRALVLGAIGAALSLLAIEVLSRLKIDDPVGVVSIFGVGGLWGTLASGTSADGVVAQLIGSLIVAAWSIVCAGVIFGLLRAARVLRISPEVEVVGLEH